MKSYEQKYKAALEWMQGMYDGLHGKTKEEAEKYFTELKESEDERIRKTIIRFFKDQYSKETEMYDGSVTVGKAIAWLEKQGEHKDYYTKQELVDMGFSFTLNGDIVTPDKMMEDMKKYLAWLEKQGEKEPAEWSDKDENMLKSIIATCELAEQDRDSSPAKHLLEMQTNWLKSLKQRIHVSSAKPCKNDSLLDLLNKMPSCITVDGLDYHFVMKKTSIYLAYYACYNGNGEEGRGNAIFGITAHSPIDLLAEMLEILKEKGLLE